MHVLVTGGFGFQGSYITKRLLEEGHTVSVINHNSRHAYRNYQTFLSGFGSRLRVEWGDITQMETVYAQAVDADLIIHTAAQINVDESREEPWRSFSVNIAGTVNVLECAKKDKIPIILASSCEVYGDNADATGLMTEDHVMKPRSPYAASKLAADRIAMSYFYTYDMPLVILRPGNVYGWGQKCGKGGALLGKWIAKILRDEPISVFGSGTQGRDWVYVEDVADGYMAVMHLGVKNLAGSVFNLGTEKCTSVLELAEILKKLHPSVEVKYEDTRPGEVTGFALDSSHAKTVLGWQAKTSVDAGVALTLLEAKARGGM